MNNNSNQAVKASDQERFIASSQLEGIKLTNHQLAMLDLFTLRGWNARQCINFINIYRKEHFV